MNEQESIYRRILTAVLASSFLIRVVLVLHGGQYYLGDEERYRRSCKAVDALWCGDVYGFVRALCHVDHFLFPVIGVIPAMIQMIFGGGPRIPALFFSLFSVASLWIMWKIMRRLGENERTSLLAAGLLSLCATFLYYSRHLVPYDAAMAFGLFSLYVGLRTSSRTIDSVLCGFFALCTFLTYSGYWTLAGFAMLTHLLRSSRTIGDYARRAFALGGSFAVPIIAMWAITAATGSDLLQKYLNFSSAITQGVFSEGWNLPFFYFWHSEHFLILLWSAALIYGLWEFLRGNRKEAMIIGLSGIIFIYGTLVLLSVGLEKFVVYGRLARQLVPFFCILTAILLEQLWISSPRRKALAVVVLVITVLQGAINFWQPLIQVFPTEFLQLAAKDSLPIAKGEYEVLFAHGFDVEGFLIYPFSCLLHPLPKQGGITILQKPHPLQYLPYLYEGYTPDQRYELQTTDISMRLVLHKQGE